jgi:hypothetical protein
MRTGEIVDLGNERRLSAALDFTSAGAELLILNGGSRAEEFIVVTMVRARVRKERRAAYCIDSGTSMHLTLPLAPGESPSDVTLRVVGGHGEMVLFAPQTGRQRRLIGVRGWSTVAAAIAMLLLASGRIDNQPLASADPVPSTPGLSVLPIKRLESRALLNVPAHLPSVVAAAPVKKPVSARGAETAAEHRLLAMAPVAAPAPKHTAAQPEVPAPVMTDLHVPKTAKSGDFVPVSFGGVAHQVKIVASIGPTVVSKTIIAARRGVTAQRGMIAIKAPQSDRDSRVMTVRAYAQNGNRTAIMQALVVLVKP